MDSTTIPTTDNTVAEIKTYLDAQGIQYSSTATKAELLALIPVTEAEQTVPAPASRYTKAQLIEFTATGAQRTWFQVALKNGQTYTYAEALEAVSALKKGGIF